MNSELAQAPVSGRRRQTPSSPKPGRRKAGSVPKLVAAVVALLGGLLVLLGALQATVWKPSGVIAASLVSPDRPVVTTAVGLLGLEGPRLDVEATAATSTSPIFVGIGRAGDVDAYLAKVSRLEVTGDNGKGRLITKQVGTQASLPDPTLADVWVVSSRGPGAAGVVWPKAAGQWRVVVFTDGTEPAAAKVTMTWSGRSQQSSAPAFISIGLVLVVAGLITLVMVGSRSKLKGTGG